MTGPSISKNNFNIVSSTSACLSLPSSKVFIVALNGWVTTSYGLKYEKFTALPTPSFHLFIGMIVAREFHGAAKLLLYASIWSWVTPVKAWAIVPAASLAPPNTTDAPINLL